MKLLKPSGTWLCGIKPSVGFKPTMPVQAAGRRVLAPASVASESGPSPAATATAEPPLDPPGVYRRSHGLRVVPNSGASVISLWANSDVVVLPMILAPACLRR